MMRSVRSEPSVEVGLIGLGRMGLPICRRLVQAGFSVRATDVRDSVRSDLNATGARWKPTAATVAADIDLLVTVLPGAVEVLDVTAEITDAMPPGAIWVEMSTASPQTAADIATAARSHGLRLLDAPVAGTPDDAQAGRLLAFVGGASTDLAAARDVIGAVADRIAHVGPHGSGYLIKLMANSLWFSQAVAVAEMLCVAQRASLDLDVVRAAIGQSAAASHFLSVDADALLAGDDHTSFALTRCCDQLDAVLSLGAQLEIPLDGLAVVSEVHHRALARYGDVSGELLGARLIADEAGVDLRRS
jgi:3-hydroxyisobutyrate dehydrogenase-like beta-hydroxyacid dehydrogenase